MKQQLESIRQAALAALEKAGTPAELEELRVKLLGKKGELTAVLKQMGKLSAEERPVMGQLANNVRAAIEERLEQRKAAVHRPDAHRLYGKTHASLPKKFCQTPTRMPRQSSARMAITAPRMR